MQGHYPFNGEKSLFFHVNLDIKSDFFYLNHYNLDISINTTIFLRASLAGLHLQRLQLLHVLYCLALQRLQLRSFLPGGQESVELVCWAPPLPLLGIAYLWHSNEQCVRGTNFGGRFQLYCPLCVVWLVTYTTHAHDAIIGNIHNTCTWCYNCLACQPTSQQ